MLTFLEMFCKMTTAIVEKLLVQSIKIKNVGIPDLTDIFWKCLQDDISLCREFFTISCQQIKEVSFFDLTEIFWICFQNDISLCREFLLSAVNKLRMSAPLIWLTYSGNVFKMISVFVENFYFQLLSQIKYVSIIDVPDMITLLEMSARRHCWQTRNAANSSSDDCGKPTKHFDLMSAGDCFR